jgi:hypothetical protein
MDVGLNNKNRLHEALDCEDLKDIVWLVEASSNEQLELWNIYHEKCNWVQLSPGYGFTITSLDVIDKKGNKEKLPIYISFSFVRINDYKIAFYSSDSLLIHHGYIKAFLLTYFQRTHDNYSRWNHTNATNFHNCIGYLDTLDKEPRDSIYIPDNNEYYIFEPQLKNGEYVENLTTLKLDTLLMDHKERIFIINKLENVGKYVRLNLSEVTDKLRSWECTLPMACDENKFFISPNDNDFKFRFEISNYSKNDVCNIILDNI